MIYEFAETSLPREGSRRPSLPVPEQRFPFPFPRNPIGTGSGNGSGGALWSRGGGLIAGGGFDHAAVGDERGESLTDIAGSCLHDIADLPLGERFCRLGEDLFDAFATGWPSGGWGWLLVEDPQHRRILAEGQRQPASARSGTMLDAELQLPADAAHVEV